jgi:formylmethanofuran dehydrogenase subunit E
LIFALLGEGPVPPQLVSMSTELPTLAFFAEIYRRHGHRCPMSTLGGRLGFAARRHLAGQGSAFAAVYRIATCAVDGIRHAIGCDEGGGTLEVRDLGAHLLTLTDLNSGRSVAVALRPEALHLAGDYRQQIEELERLRPSLTPEQLRQGQQRTDALLDALLERLRSLPDDELLSVCSPLAAGPLPGGDP